MKLPPSITYIVGHVGRHLVGQHALRRDLLQVEGHDVGAAVLEAPVEGAVADDEADGLAAGNVDVPGGIGQDDDLVDGGLRRGGVAAEAGWLLGGTGVGGGGQVVAVNREGSSLVFMMFFSDSMQ